MAIEDSGYCYENGNRERADVIQWEDIMMEEILIVIMMEWILIDIMMMADILEEDIVEMKENLIWFANLKIW